MTNLRLNNNNKILVQARLHYNQSTLNLNRRAVSLSNRSTVLSWFRLGNIFAEDENGRLFYIGGNVNERPAVCDMDKPLMTSTVRREVPAMSDADFDRIDALAGGKLRHLLVGSPSGYEWNEQVETILQSEAYWKEKEGIPVDSKMLPESARPRLIPEPKPSLLEIERQKFLQESSEEWRELEKQLEQGPPQQNDSAEPKKKAANE